MDTITRLQKIIPESLDALLLTDELTIRYLTGFLISDGYLIIGREKGYLLTDFRYYEAAREKESPALSVICFTDSRETIGTLLSSQKFSRIGFEDRKTTCAAFEQLKKKFPLADFSPIGTLIDTMRQIKNPDEISAIIKAQRIAEKAYDRLLSLLSPQMTEIEVAAELEYGMKKLGSERPAFDTIAVSGSASSRPHGVPRNVPLEKGFLTLDFGAVVDGYCSDMTRTVSLGRADNEMKKVYHTVLAAQKAALSVIAAGKTGSECDAAARQIIDHEGFAGTFGHSLGHGVGLYIHEEPRLSTAWNQALLPGQVVTVEPGIYLEGRFGVRIEDMVTVTADGCDNLTLAPKELIELF